MNNKWKTTCLPILALGCGGIGGALWALMQRLCQDDKGLLIPWNLPGILILLLSVAVVAGVVLLTRPLGGSNRYGDNFAPSLVGGIAAFAAAVIPCHHTTDKQFRSALRDFYRFSHTTAALYRGTGNSALQAKLIATLRRTAPICAGMVCRLVDCLEGNKPLDWLPKENFYGASAR